MKKCDLTGTGTGTEIINLPGPGPIIQFYRDERDDRDDQDDRDDRDQNWYSHIESCNFHLHYN